MLVWFVFGFMCAAAVFLVAAYFKFVSLRRAVQHAQKRLDVVLHNRRDLLPALAWSAAAVPHLEREFSYSLGKMKEKLSYAEDMSRRIACESEVSRSLQKLFAAADEQVDLKKDEYFIKLQRGLLAAESRINQCKKRYNSAARDFNTLAAVFPFNRLARLLDFEPYEYFDFEPGLDKILR